MPYNSKLSLLETQKAIELVKVTFEDLLCRKLNFTRISPPLFVETDSGLNDDLSGLEKAVIFDPKCGKSVSVVHSLAKWKRLALKNYQFKAYSGFYADMNAIRREEDLDPLHSYYVDQWDWEQVIQEADRNMDYLISVGTGIYECIKETEDKIVKEYPVLNKKLPDNMVVISSQEMEDKYPELSPEERENKFTEEYGAVFLTQIGKRLKSGEKHGNRAPDFDDWDLNADILVHNPSLINGAFELSSMGVRVTKESLVTQLTERGTLGRLNLPFHKALANGELPFTIGGGVGQSRLCMFLLDKIHIGEVQASVWDDRIIEECKAQNIRLL